MSKSSHARRAAREHQEVLARKAAARKLYAFDSSSALERYRDECRIAQVLWRVQNPDRSREGCRKYYREHLGAERARKRRDRMTWQDWAKSEVK